MAAFSRDGFHGASMQKICAEAGMSPGALYRYFPSKESIIAAIVEDERAERLRLFDSLAAAPSIIDGLTEAMAVLLKEPTLPTGKLGPEIMAEAIRNAKLREAIEPCETESHVLMTSALQQAVAQGEIDPDLPLEDVHILLQIIGDGLMLNHQLHPEWRIAERLPTLSDLVRRMLAPAAKGDGK